MPIDFKKTVAAYRARVGVFDVVTPPVARFLMIDGHGDPNASDEYRDAIATIYPVAYRLKFHSKGELARDYVVPPLEGLWWAADMSSFTTGRDKSAWDWTLMSLVPEWISAEAVDRVVASLRAKDAPPRLADMRVEVLDEGLCVQTLHVGPYDAEGPVLERMHHEVIPARGFELVGRHHEIYLGDARRAAPERLRTILRQPVRPAG